MFLTFAGGLRLSLLPPPLQSRLTPSRWPACCGCRWSPVPPAPSSQAPRSQAMPAHRCCDGRRRGWGSRTCDPGSRGGGRSCIADAHVSTAASCWHHCGSPHEMPGADRRCARSLTIALPMPRRCKRRGGVGNDTDATPVCHVELGAAAHHIFGSRDGLHRNSHGAQQGSGSSTCCFASLNTKT